MDNNFYMNFEESQDYITKRGFDIPWNDCDVFVDERDITRTVANVLKWADTTTIEKAKTWVKSCFIGSFGEGLTNNIINDFVKYLEE